MKQLYSNGKFGLFHEGNNYQVGTPAEDEKGKLTVQSPKHYHCIDAAVKALAKYTANEEAEELFEWLAIYQEVNENATEALNAHRT